MVDSDKDNFEEQITKFCLVHRQAKSPQLLRAYWDDLDGMSRAEFDSACKYLKRTAKWMPKPCDFWSAKRVGWQ